MSTTSDRPIEVGVRLVDDGAIRGLNRDWRGRDKPTNVLSFPLGEPVPVGDPALPWLIGDIVMSFDTVVAEAERDGKPLDHHVAHLAIHATLHLIGHDHEDEAEAEAMEAAEVKLLAGLGIPDPYQRVRRGRSLMANLRSLFRGPASPARSLPPLDRGSGRASEQSHERKLIENILEIRDQPISELMVPRADIVAVETDTERDALLRLLVDRSHSRLPVYRDTLDDVIGIVHIKDVLASIARGADFALPDIVRPVSIVAPSMRVLDLLLDMRKTRQHMALVVDEFGGIDGLITIEDLVEGIVGEITDEHDRAVSPSMVEKADGSLLADARVPIEDFEERVGPVLEQDERDEVDTLGGLVFSLAGRVPSRGELLTHPSSGLEFEIIDADPRRIKRIRVRNPPPPPTAK